MSKGGKSGPMPPTGPGTVPPGQGGTTPTYGGGFGAGTMGTTYDYPTRYSADYTRYAQSGQPFNQPVMGYNTYGQIFAQPQRPPPSMGGKGGGGFGGGFGGFRPQPPSFGGKGGGGFRPQPPPGMILNPDYTGPRQVPEGGFTSMEIRPGENRYIADPNYDPNRRMQANPGFDTPFGNFPQRRRPERRTNQFGLNQPPQNSGVPGSFLDFYSRQNNLPEPPLEYAEPAPIVDMNQEFRSYPGGSTYLPSGAIEAPINVRFAGYDSNIANSPFGQLIGGGLGGMGGNSPRPEDFTRPILNQLEPYNVGMVRNPNYSPTSSMLDNAPPPGSDEYFRRQAFIPADGGFRMAFQEGGQVPPDANMEMMLSETGPANPQSEMAGEYDRLIQMTMQAILGQVENPDEVIQMFIDEFGTDAFRQLRDAVLKQQVPNAQTEGMVDGNGGGMDDQVMGMIGNQRPVAVSPGEYIIPADVVSGLGDGSSKSGADILDELNQAVRMARTGTTEQPRPLMETLQ